MNILITGTPGCGKTTFCESFIEAFPATSLASTDPKYSISHYNISDLVKDNKLHDGFDEKFQSYILDDDKLLDFMEDNLHFSSSRQKQKINLIDYHTCEVFPESWIDLVVVLTTDNTTLYDRLAARGYSAIKIEENISCEIMQVVLSEAQESYAESIVFPLESCNQENLQRNLQFLTQKIQERLNKNKDL